MLILGGDGVVGQALELLLRSTDYDVRFITAYSLELRTLDGVELVILYPGTSAEDYETLLTLAESTSVAEIPILELVKNLDDVRAESRYLLPWPCRTEDLKRQISAILLAGSGSGRDSC